jgi:glycerate dehydrogenase
MLTKGRITLKIAFLDAKTLGKDADLSVLDKFGKTEKYETTKYEDVVARSAGCDIVITNKTVIDRAAVNSLDKLKLICVAATGTNIVDIDACREKGVAVTNVAGYSTASVAQITFGLLFYMLESLAYHDNFVKSGLYAESDTFNHLGRPFRELCSMRFGIIGLGSIGAKVAAIAESFGSEVVYYSTSGKNKNSTFKSASLEELLSSSDIVSIHCPLNEKTKNLIDYEKLKTMKRTAILLNTARGGIVCEASLARAIDENIIAAAGIDVYTKEPVSPDNPLLSVKNQDRLILTPHIAFTSVEARKRLASEIAENISAFIRGEKRNRVD